MSQIHKLLFVGDVVLNSQPRISAEIEHIFNEAVIRCCNVEAPLRGFGQTAHKTGPLVDQAPKSAEWLRAMGFNLFAMANNHIHDYGDDGLLATREAFGADNTIGIGTEEQAYAIHTQVIDGLRYGFLAYGENGFGALNGDRETGYAWINHPKVNDDIRTYKAQTDILIIQVHCGVEMLDVPIPEWRQRYRELIDLGADMIIGHHPHIVQGIETYKDRYICYSLGNFSFDYPSRHPEWNIGSLLQIEVRDGKIQKCELRISEKKGKQVELWDYERSARKVKELTAKLESEAYLTYIDKEALLLWNQHHRRYYAKAVNGLVDYSIIGVLKHFKRILLHRKIDHSMLWHNLFIESNLWLVQRAVNQLNSKQQAQSKNR